MRMPGRWRWSICAWECCWMRSTSIRWRDETLLVVTSPRGYPLGEHRRVGPCDEALYGELLHVPLLVRFPGDEHALARSQQIVQPGEICSLVAEACGWRRGDRASKMLRELTRRSIDRVSAWPVRIGPSSSGRFARRPGSCASRRRDGERRLRAVCQAGRSLGSERGFVALRRRRGAAEQPSWIDSRSAAREGRLAESPPLAEVLCDVWRWLSGASKRRQNPL